MAFLKRPGVEASIAGKLKMMGDKLEIFKKPERWGFDSRQIENDGRQVRQFLNRSSAEVSIADKLKFLGIECEIFKKTRR